MNHIVEVLSCSKTYKKSGKRYRHTARKFTAIVDGINIEGTFTLRLGCNTSPEGYEYNINRDYVFRFPKGCLITKQKDWKDIRLQILEGCTKIIKFQLDHHLLRSTNAPRVSKGTPKG